jgi:hypothetical protein
VCTHFFSSSFSRCLDPLDYPVARILLGVASRYYRFKDMNDRETLEDRVRRHPIWLDMPYWEEGEKTYVVLVHLSLCICPRVSRVCCCLCALSPWGSINTHVSQLCILKLVVFVSPPPTAFFEGIESARNLLVATAELPTDDEWPRLAPREMKQALMAEQRMVDLLLESFGQHMMRLGVTPLDTRKFIANKCLIHSLPPLVTEGLLTPIKQAGAAAADAALAEEEAGGGKAGETGEGVEGRRHSDETDGAAVVKNLGASSFNAASAGAEGSVGESSERTHRGDGAGNSPDVLGAADVADRGGGDGTVDGKANGGGSVLNVAAGGAGAGGGVGATMPVVGNGANAGGEANGGGVEGGAGRGAAIGGGAEII